MLRLKRTLIAFAICWHLFASPSTADAIDIVLDYSLDANNEVWFGDTAAGLARRAAVDSAAGLLSSIITNDDWDEIFIPSESISFTDIAASSLNDLNGNPVFGSPESDGQGFDYDIDISNRSTVGANEYVIYVGAFEFDAGTSAHAKASWDSSDRRNAAGVAATEFNTWGGKIYFDTGNSWYTGQNPGIDPTDDYGWQDPEKFPSADITTDNWDWNTNSLTWKGFDLEKIDLAADNRTDLYATALHEMLHALGATSSNMTTYVGVSGNELIGENLVAEYGGPVPKSSESGHFAENVQSEVWDSDGIISEVSLDPNSLRGRRKYLTNLDAALLRDLGYEVLSEFAAADFDRDGDVDDKDLLKWESDFGDSGSDADRDGDVDGTDFLAWQRQLENGQLGNVGELVASTNSIPEPSTILLLSGIATFWISLRAYQKSC